jgi:hypothetical protein
MVSKLMGLFGSPKYALVARVVCTPCLTLSKFLKISSFTIKMLATVLWEWDLFHLSGKATHHLTQTLLFTQLPCLVIRSQILISRLEAFRQPTS